MIPFIVLYLKSQHHPLSSPAGSAPEVCAAFLTRCKYGSKPDDLDISAQTYRAAPSKQVFSHSMMCVGQLARWVLKLSA